MLINLVLLHLCTALEIFRRIKNVFLNGWFFSENMEHRSGGREYLPLWCFGRDGEYIALKITPDKRSNSQEGQENIYPCLKLICENIYPWKMEGVSDVCGGQDVFLIHYGLESFLTIFLFHFWQSWFSCARKFMAAGRLVR